MDYKLFHETLGSAIDESIAYLARKECVCAESLPERFQFDGIRYEETKTEHLEIATLKGKKTRKFAHVVIYRMSSGRYELTIYFL